MSAEIKVLIAAGIFGAGLGTGWYAQSVETGHMEVKYERLQNDITLERSKARTETERIKQEAANHATEERRRHQAEIDAGRLEAGAALAAATLERDRLLERVRAPRTKNRIPPSPGRVPEAAAPDPGPPEAGRLLSERDREDLVQLGFAAEGTNGQLAICERYARSLRTSATPAARTP